MSENRRPSGTRKQGPTKSGGRQQGPSNVPRQSSQHRQPIAPQSGPSSVPQQGSQQTQSNAPPLPPSSTQLPAVPTAAPANGAAVPAPPGFTLQEVVPEISKAYKALWKNCPYSSFLMFDFLLLKVKEASWEAFFGKHCELGGFGLDEQAIAAVRPHERLWQSKSGLCTSFMMRVLENADVPGSERLRRSFIRGDNGGHRATWFVQDKKGIVVDSSARKALPFRDVPGMEKVLLTAKHIYWKFEGTPQGGGNPPFMNATINLRLQENKNRSSPPDASEYRRFNEMPMTVNPVTRCLQDLLKSEEIITMFRCQKERDELGSFYGKLTWHLIDCTCSFSGWTQEGNYNILVSFSHSNARINNEFQNALFLFNYWLDQTLPGHTDTRGKQFSDILQTSNRMWAAALRMWGNPIIKIIENGKGGNANITASSLNQRREAKEAADAAKRAATSASSGPGGQSNTSGAPSQGSPAGTGAGESTQRPAAAPGPGFWQQAAPSLTSALGSMVRKPTSTRR